MNKSPYATMPFSLRSNGMVEDANGQLVLVCSNDHDADCPLRFNDGFIDRNPHYMCPLCGRLGIRMDDARPDQCGITVDKSPTNLTPTVECG